MDKKDIFDYAAIPVLLLITVAAFILAFLGVV